MVLQRVAVHVAGRVAVRCSASQSSDLEYVAGPGVQVARGVVVVLQCVAVCCSACCRACCRVLQRVAVQ